ncbi:MULTISPECIES: hypothetical protein [unclassified Mesotoga]|jgi:hypothetical protein|uniref:hypothetical protein n=1 Tax=unclassified Mesotoga TaxID=1184398 RepID=UPI0002CAE91E|nr:MULTISPECIES: hypothetical protein [unclassified Mesotoga]RLL82609.1 hypothetical protein Y696_00495 [Mesotoga sp. H07pep.5.4]RLL92851.1 hypothetical protein BG32_13140 [Mesotoga sp. HF07.pep.5.2.highcov]CCU85039.1 hypothetical protein PHOSAC3_150039 [Mesotoga infera]
MSLDWMGELGGIIRSAIERKLDYLNLEKQWENSLSTKGLLYAENVRRREVLLCRRELETYRESGSSFLQARTDLLTKLSDRLTGLLLEIKQMEKERILPYTILSVSDLTDDFSTAHYVYLCRNPSDNEPLSSSIRDELKKLSSKYPERFHEAEKTILPREYDTTFIVGFINHFYESED